MLHDTYGFPVASTQDHCRLTRFFSDMECFETEMDKQRERAKAAQKYGVGGNATAAAEAGLEGKPTVFVGYEKTKSHATIVSLLSEGESVGVINEGQEASLVLTLTPFYAEMGGQVGDNGEITKQIRNVCGDRYREDCAGDSCPPRYYGERDAFNGRSGRG